MKQLVIWKRRLMEIKSVKKTKYGFNIFINEELLNIENKIYFKYKLKEGLKLDSLKLNEILSENKIEFIKRKSITYLNRRRSTREFILYLSELEAPKSLVYSLTEEYTKKGYLDDYFYAKEVFNKEKSRYGKKKIKEILINKGIKNEIILSLLEEYEDDSLEELIKNAAKSVKANNYKDARLKLARLFLNKGYELNSINYYIDIYLDKASFNEEEAIKKLYLSALNRYEKKYSGRKLDDKIRNYLHNKGFTTAAINKVIRGDVDV